MRSRPLKVTCIHHPTVALKISGFTQPEFAEIAETGGYLGNVYRRIIPPSLPRVAAALEQDADVSADILDLRILDPEREETCREIDWEGYKIEVQRVGGPFSAADAAIDASDWIALSSHFTFESGVIRNLIAYAKRRNPAVKVMVGGADVKARAADYLAMGADLAFVGDYNPQAFRDYWRERLPLAPGPRILGPYSHPFHDLVNPDFSKLAHLREYRESHDGPVPEGVSFPIGFIYFTRGCPRECDFCESRKSKFEVLDLDSATAMLENYRRAGIQSLNFSDDNLLLMAAQPAGRAALLAVFGKLRELGFAWEFPNGLEIGRLIDRHDQLDEELMEAIFAHHVDPQTGRLVGAYRAYIPVETFDHRADYKKLRSVQDQNRIIAWLAGCGLSELDFGVVLPPDATAETFESIRRGYRNLRELIESRGATRARYAVFHLIPISLFRSMPTKYSVEAFPEGWNFYFPVYDGAHFTARELFERRLRLISEIDHQNFVSMAQGEYRYA